LLTGSHFDTGNSFLNVKCTAPIHNGADPDPVLGPPGVGKIRLLTLGAINPRSSDTWLDGWTAFPES